MESEQTHLVREGLDLVVALEEELLAFLGEGLGGLSAEGGSVDFVAELDEALGRGRQCEHGTRREGRGVGGTTRVERSVSQRSATPSNGADPAVVLSTSCRQRRARATLA
jgi:hypothetical protein